MRLGLLVFSLLATVSSIQASNQNAVRNYQTAVLEPVCGFSDDVFDYIYQRMGDNKPKDRLFSSGRQGASKRFLMIYNDISWVMTYEYSHFSLSMLDISCIIGTGSKSELQDMIDSDVPKFWPAKSIGGYKGSIPPKPYTPDPAKAHRAWDI